MTIVNFIVGADSALLEQDEILLETTRRSQEIRTTHSLLSTGTTVLAGALVAGSLWNRTDNTVLVIWVLAISALAVWHIAISRRLKKNLVQAGAHKLIQNEADLLFTGLAIPALAGASVWLFGLSNNREITIIVMLLCFLCAIGSTLKTGAQRRIHALMVTLNLGQCVLYYLVCADLVSLVVAALLSASIVLLLLCGERKQELMVGVISSDIEVKNQSRMFLHSHAENEAALREAVDANQTRSRFLAAASHDLNQPLNAMSLFIGNLKQNFEGDEKQYELVQGIESTAEILKQQFDGMLDISRYDAGGVTVQNQQFDLYELCEILAQAEKISAGKNKVKVSVTGDRVKVNSDPVLLGRLISNLIGNAVKFTREGMVTVNLERLENELILRVTDTGCGFTETEKEQIFNDFVQLNKAGSDHNRGVGLGLSIVRRISALLDVELQVMSTPGVGSEFTLIIPNGRGDTAIVHRKSF